MRGYKSFTTPHSALLGNRKAHENNKSIYCRQIAEARDLEALLRFSDIRDQLNFHALSCERCAILARPIWNDAVSRLCPDQQGIFGKLVNAWHPPCNPKTLDSPPEPIAKTLNSGTAGELHFVPVRNEGQRGSWLNHLDLGELQNFCDAIVGIDLNSTDGVKLISQIDDKVRQLESKEMDEQMFADEPERIGFTSSCDKNKVIFQHQTYRPHGTERCLENACISTVG
jgi:hypothetical protein